MITGDRISTFRKKKELNQTEFGKALGYTQSQVSSYEKGALEIPIGFIEKLHTQFGVDLNKVMGTDEEWSAYLNAYPSAYLLEESQQFKTAESGVTIHQTPVVSLFPATVTVDEAGKDNIVFVDVKAAAGYAENLTHKVYFKNLPSFKLPGNRFRHGTFRAFEVEGESMADNINAGEWVICRNLGDLSAIRDGYCHVVVTNSGVVVKRLLNRVESRGKLVCTSDNQVFRPYEIDAADVLEVWVLVCKITFDFASRKHDLQLQLNSVKDVLASIETRLKSAGI